MWDDFHPYSKNDLNLEYKHSWTVDKNKEIFFIPVAVGKEECSNRVTCILWLEGYYLNVVLEKFGPPQLPENTIRWDLINISRPKDFIYSDAEIESILREALLVYGYRGIDKQFSDLIVTFGF